jgi:glycerophosphoryl diester phosphodiesterase
MKKHWKFIGIAILIVIVGWSGLRLAFRSTSITEPYMVGHRGAMGLAPENTIASLQKAVDHHVNLIEVDVHRTVDGELVVIHDNSLTRTTNGDGKIKEMTWAELSQLEAGSHFSLEFAGEPIPRLQDVIDFCKANDVILVLEGKYTADYPGMEQQILALLAANDMLDQIILISFDHEWVDGIHDLAPEMPVGYLCKNIDVNTLPADGKVIVDAKWTALVFNPLMIYQAHQRGYEVVAYTVNEPWKMKLLYWLGVDGITTNRPDVWNATFIN